MYIRRAPLLQFLPTNSSYITFFTRRFLVRSIYRPFYHQNTTRASTSTTMKTLTTTTTNLPLSQNRTKILVITGPTNSGKSRLSLEVAKKHNGEIVIADSVQVYKGLDIGSNKVSSHEQNTTPHHLVDILNSTDGFNASKFLDYAIQAIEEISEHEKLPIVVGGTMMYIKWLVRGRPSIPEIIDKDVKERVRIMLEKCEGDWNKGIDILKEKDLERANELLKNDWYRLRRALEVFESEGIGMSRMPKIGACPGVDDVDCVKRRDNNWDLRLVFLWKDKWELYKDIDKRCEDMLIGKNNWGLLEEVEYLLGNNLFYMEKDGPARSIGYRQTIEYLTNRAILFLLDKSNNSIKMKDKEDRFTAFRDFIHDFTSATRRYAKQQISWFRKDTAFFWIHAGDSNTVSKIVEMNREDYDAFIRKEYENQAEVRNFIMEQGNKMKFYISERTTLREGSARENELVRRAESAAQRLARKLGKSGLDTLRERIRLLNCV